LTDTPDTATINCNTNISPTAHTHMHPTLEHAPLNSSHATRCPRALSMGLDLVWTGHLSYLEILCLIRHSSACPIPLPSHRHGLANTYYTLALSSLPHIHLWQLAMFSLVAMPYVVISSFTTYTYMCPSPRCIPLHQGSVIFYCTCPTLGCIPLHSSCATGCSNELFVCFDPVGMGHLSHSEI
jgi:hypothetical protein